MVCFCSLFACIHGWHCCHKGSMSPSCAFMDLWQPTFSQLAMKEGWCSSYFPLSFLFWQLEETSPNLTSEYSHGWRKSAWCTRKSTGLGTRRPGFGVVAGRQLAEWPEVAAMLGHTDFGTSCQTGCPPNCCEVIREAVQEAWEKLGGHKLELTYQGESFHTLLGISLTQLDPVRHKLLFFRFLKLSVPNPQPQCRPSW